MPSSPRDRIELEYAEALEQFVPTKPSFRSRRSKIFTFLLLLSSLGLILYLTYYFGAFSTLHVYLVFMCYTLPVYFLLDVMRWMAGRLPLSRGHIARTGALLCVVLYVLLSLTNMPRTYNPSLAPKGVYFIASNLFNSENVLPAYSETLLRIAAEVGYDRIFVSIYENNSKDRTPQLLHELDTKLAAKGVARRIRTEVLPDSFYHQDRIDKLATLRNRALEPLYTEAQHGLHGHSFDKVIFINDIFFTPETFYKLIRTENGQFDQACAVDFWWMGHYDTWIVRDTNGKATRPLWPYFYSWRDQAIVARRGNVPVNSCWNGITAFDARWFLPDTNTSAHQYHIPGKTEEHFPVISRLPFPIQPHDDGFDAPATLPIRFRSSNVCYESECLLSSLDMHRIARPLRPRIFLNTDLAVAYDPATFFMFDWLLRWNLVYPWHLLWERLISNGLFSTAGEIDRSDYPCEIKKMNHLWVPPT